MPLHRAAWALFVLLASSIPGAGAADETILTFERRSRKILHRPSSQGGPVASDSLQADILVALGDRRLSVYEPDGVWVYDFDRRRVYGVDLKSATYTDWSLFALVAFNDMELDYRLTLRSQLMAARPGAGPSVLDLETLFSMRAPPRSSARESLADSSRGDEVRFLINHSLAVWATPSETALAPARQAVFERFLLFRCPMHPAARRALARTGKIPARLFYRYRDFNEETQVVLTLKRIDSAPEANNPMAASKRVEVPGPEHGNLARLLAACRSCAEKPDRPWIASSHRFEMESLAKGQYLDAALARTERTLACENPAAWPPATAHGARADSALLVYESASQWADSAGARKASERLEGIDRSRLEKAHILALSAGRARIAAGDRQGGTQLLLLGVGGNPCLAGAWQELARGYLASYEPVLAWICFDAARTLVPAGCAVASEGERLERSLLARHPEFFE